MFAVRIKTGTITAVLLLSFCLCVIAQDESSQTRAGIWQKQREEKSTKLQPEKQKGMEKGLLYLEKKGFQQILDYNYKGIHPSFANLSTGSGFAPGARFWKENIGGSFFDLEITANYSFRGYQLYQVQAGKFYQGAQEYFLSANDYVSGPLVEIVPKRKRSFVFANVRFRHFPQEDFFGLGPDSQKEDRTDYLIEDTSYDGVIGYQFNRWLGAGARVGYLKTDVGEGTDSRFPNTELLFDENTAPGLTQDTDYLRLSSAVFLDFRDIPGKPHKGGAIGFLYNRYDDRDGDEFQFRRYAFDARGYLPLGSVARVFAVRFFTSFDDPTSGAQVPFYLMDTLGGSQTLRGFREFRFRDRNLLYLSGEYRWEASPAIEGAFFYDTGKVFSDRDDFDFTDLEKNWGVGLRFKTKSAVIFRLDVGFSNEGTRIFFKFAPAF